MEKKKVFVVFNRKNKLDKAGLGILEVRIQLSREVRKIIAIGKCKPQDYPAILDEKEIKDKVAYYEDITAAMEKLHEEMSLSNLNKHLGIEEKDNSKKNAKPINFIDWLRDAIASQNLRPNTIRQKMVTFDALVEYGKIKLFSDLTPSNIYGWDSWLREKGNRTDVTVFNYHRRLHPYIKLAYQQGILEEDPYSRCKFNRGRSKERKPLTEEELKKVRELELTGKLERVRDLFIFSAYTGLAYCDVMDFNFKTMTEEHNGVHYIDGERLKTGSSFFTPILPPAMEVLKKYNNKLPRISNQKGNDYLHLVQAQAGINKSMTFHVARHSFGTLTLSHDIPIDKVARMMGHKNIKTTQIYAKVLKTTIEKHTSNLISNLL